MSKSLELLILAPLILVSGVVHASPVSEDSCWRHSYVQGIAPCDPSAEVTIDLVGVPLECEGCQ